MFTGIITAVGAVAGNRGVSGGCELTIASPWDDIEPGESIAVDGACLTVTKCADRQFAVHVITTSLDRTLFRGYRAGRRVNLERALRAGDRLGGHLVQGHVDGIGTVESVLQRDDARLVVIRVPTEVAAISIPLGSITVDGVSLTVDAIPSPEMVQVSLIPFTLQHTTLGDKAPGDQVHLEGDTVGKYVQHFWAAWSAAGPR
jgi:riboflavin synthase